MDILIKSLVGYAYQALLFNRFVGGYKMSFMNKGMQNGRQRKVTVTIVGLVLASFLLSIVAMGIW